MPQLRRVAVRFPTRTEVRYLERPPEPGEEVLGERNVYVVGSTRSDGSGGFVVDCIGPQRRASAPSQQQGARERESG